MTKKLTIKYSEIQEIVVGEVPTYPKYVTQILNLANQNAQGTRPRVVGQMSELIPEFDGRTLEEWTAWYRERHPNAVQDATERIERMVENLRVAIASIDHEMIRTWVEDLVLLKTFADSDFRWLS